MLTTNFHESLDDALARRISARVAFPMPGPQERTRLWYSLLPERAPRAADIDWAKLGERFELSGGHIRNAVLRAAFDAAEVGGALDMAGLWRGAVETTRELGRLVTREMATPPSPGGARR